MATIALRSLGPGLACAVLALLLVLPAAPARSAETPVRGGELVFVVPASGFPSMDAHREETFAVLSA